MVVLSLPMVMRGGIQEGIAALIVVEALGRLRTCVDTCVRTLGRNLMLALFAVTAVLETVTSGITSKGDMERNTPIWYLLDYSQ